MKIIVTGFGSFLENTTNPTKEIINRLPNKIDNKEIHKIELPVVFDECFNVLKPHIDKVKPDVIILLGLAGGRRAITPERIAINLKDSTGPDNNGYIPKDETIIDNGKIAYYSTLPIRKIEEILNGLEIPVSISNSAGLYVCNNIMYHVLNYLEQENLETLAGFIHVPYSNESKPKESVFSMPLDDIEKGIYNIIKQAF